MADDRDQQAAPAGGAVVWPRPVHDRIWVDGSGVEWRMRGPALEEKAARRLLRRSDLRVVHAYDGEVTVVTGAERERLTLRILGFLHGDAAPDSEFVLGDFRDDEHRITLMVQEHC